MEEFDYTPGKVLSEAEGFCLIEHYLSSGKSSAVFYKEIGMSEKTFYKWRRRYVNHQSEKERAVPTPASSDTLVPIRISSTSTRQQPELTSSTGYVCEVEFPNGIRVRLNNLSEADRLLYICQHLK